MIRRCRQIALDDIGRVKRKSAMEHAQNVRIPWSAHAQADPVLRCPHMLEDTISHGAADIV